MTELKLFNRASGIPGLLVLGLFAGATVDAAPKPPKPSIAKIIANDVAHTLSVEGKAKSAVEIYDADADQWLATQTPDSKGKFKFALSNLPTMPCSVRVVAGGASVTKPVSKSSACTKGDLPPVCKISNPLGDTVIAFKDLLSFTADAKDPDGSRLHYEWDFGGGASDRRTSKNATDVKFDVRNNTIYTVSFTATDVAGRRCTDRVNVTVGTAPMTPENKVSEQTPKAGDPDYAILPFQPYGMAFHDLSYGLYSMVIPTNWLSTQVLQKGTVGTDKPVFLEPKDVDVQYSAASNPQDPVGKDSINSTSKNYPTNKTYGEASIKKSDWFDPCQVWTNTAANTDNAGDVQYGRFFDTYLEQNPYAMRGPIARPTGGDAAISGNRTNAECNVANFFYPNWDSSLLVHNPDDPKSFSYMLLDADSGAAFWTYDLISRFEVVRPGGEGFPGFKGVLEPNGQAMPGVGAAYVANEPQAFPSATMPETGDNYPGFDNTRKLFAAVGMPTFPTDDKGRHNAYPVMRLQAHDKTGKLLATTDAVTAVTTEFKCAECHVKGKNGADQAVYDALRADMAKRPLAPKLLELITSRKGSGYDANKLDEYVAEISKWIPVFLAPEDVNAARKDDRDVIEQASMVNIARLHDFYYNFMKDSQWLGPLEFESEQVYGVPGKPAKAATQTEPAEPAVAGDMHVEPANCTDYCHKSVPHADPRRYNMAPVYDADSACPELSDSLHNIHGRLLTAVTGKFDATKAAIVRDPVTRELILADLTKPADTSKQFLLTAKDAGTPDESCFYCHAGKQDKYQRDVMTTAGVNCIDCHGDLAVLAGGGAMVSRDEGGNPLDSRGGLPDLTAEIDKDKLANAYMAERSSYGPEADGNWYFLEKGQDGLYRRKGTVVTTLTMALNFISGTTGVDNGNGTYTLTVTETGATETVDDAALLAKADLKRGVNSWLLSFTRIPWAQELSCANCHTGEGDEAVRRRSYDMTTGQFRLLPVTNERFAENLQPKKHDSSFVLEVQNGQDCPPGTYSDTVKENGKHVCERGLFKDSIDRHGKVSCEACHGPTHGVWPNPDPYANDNVTAMQLQGHTGTILECEACHTKESFKTEASIGSTLNYPDGIMAGPHNMHPVNDPYWYFNDRTGSNPKANDVDGSLKGGWHNVWAAKPGVNGEDQCASCHGKDHKGTRLSKTPVDRILKTGKEKKYKDVTVKAGTQIGCDLCHSLEQSFPKK